MGQAKKEMMRLEEIPFDAIEIAIEAEVLKRCRFHEDTVLDIGGDPTDAYRLGNAKFSAGEAGDFGSRREMTDTIKSVIEESGDECYSCEKWKEE